MKIPFLVIGGGLSGLAAAIRFARYSPEVLIVEKHARVGGLNSFYYRKKILLETGLHAVTNYAPADAKKAPLNLLFRQLKLKRKDFTFFPQIGSEICFDQENRLSFTNEFEVFCEDIRRKFPSAYDGFSQLIRDIESIDPFAIRPYQSAKKFIADRVKHSILTDMLLCPLMFYGSSVEDDMDLSQFVIMFRSIYMEGMFRPAGSIKDFLETLLQHYTQLGGEIRLNCGVKRIICEGDRAARVELENGENIECDFVLSTIGYAETMRLMRRQYPHPHEKRLGFVESIFLIEPTCKSLPGDKTIIFYNNGERFNYSSPNGFIDTTSGVICFPYNFHGREIEDHIEVRSTHLANFSRWQQLSKDSEGYKEAKEQSSLMSMQAIKNYIGDFSHHITFRDTFTPLTIERYTSKKDGAIYGSPYKVKDGDVGLANLYLAGTDQGFLGIVGAMLSGISMVNQHILPRI